MNTVESLEEEAKRILTGYAGRSTITPDTIREVTDRLLGLLGEEKKVGKVSISLKDAYRLLCECKAVIVDGDALCYPEADVLNGDPENQWLRLSYIDSNMDQYCWYFIEEDQDIQILGNVIYMKDDHDDMCELELLGPLSTSHA